MRIVFQKCGRTGSLETQQKSRRISADEEGGERETEAPQQQQCVVSYVQVTHAEELGWAEPPGA